MPNAEAQMIILNYYTEVQWPDLLQSDHAKFVRFFRQASPYIEGHRGRTFVIVVPGYVGSRGVRIFACRQLDLCMSWQVSSDRSLLNSILNDVSVLHGGYCTVKHIPDLRQGRYILATCSMKSLKLNFCT